MEREEDTTLYKVVVHHEEQYSIWPAHRYQYAGRYHTRCQARPRPEQCHPGRLCAPERHSALRGDADPQ